MKHFFFVLAMLANAVAANCQQPGCTDPFASNFDNSATVNNGSCAYTVTNYNPPVKVDPITDSLIESSGLQMAGGYLWSFNDNGGKAAFYRIDTLTNALRQRIIFNGISNSDWEELAFDGTYFYIGDFGNNLTGGRNNLTIYKFRLDAIDLTIPVDTIQFNEIETIHFTYGDQPQPAAPSGYNNTKFDCEAMVVCNDQIHLFSKNWAENSTTHYVINSTHAGSYIAAPMETLATGYLVTAAAKLQAQNVIVLLGYQNSGTGKHFLHILSDYRADSFFTGNKRRIDLPDATAMGQGEGLCFSTGKYGYISNEQFLRMVGPFTFVVNQKLKSFDISPYVNNYFSVYTFNGNGNWSNAANWQYGIKPPAHIYPGNEIIIDPQLGGSCVLDIPYSMPAGTKISTQPGKNFLIQGNLFIQ